MATLSALVKAIADIQGLEKTQVAWIARHLREAGLIAQGGRGRGGAQMTARDASNLLIGVNAPGAPAAAVATVIAFRDLTVVRDASGLPDEQERTAAERLEGDEFERSMGLGSGFGDALESVLQSFRGSEAGEGSDNERVTMKGPNPEAEIFVGDLSDPQDPEVYFYPVFVNIDHGSEKSAPDRVQQTSFTGRTLAAVAAAIFN